MRQAIQEPSAPARGELFLIAPQEHVVDFIQPAVPAAGLRLHAGAVRWLPAHPSSAIATTVHAVWEDTPGQTTVLRVVVV